MKTLYWDFFGPNAEPTARHFMTHLDDFLVRNACAGCITGTSSNGPGHHAVYCRTLPEYEQGLTNGLRPQRVVDED
jgi:hypothetical protein